MCEAGGLYLCVCVREYFSTYLIVLLRVFPCVFGCVYLHLFVQWLLCVHVCLRARVCVCVRVGGWVYGNVVYAAFMQSNYVDLIGFVYVESVPPPVMYNCYCGQPRHTGMHAHTHAHTYAHTLLGAAYFLLCDWIMWSVSFIIRDLNSLCVFKKAVAAKLC